MMNLQANLNKAMEMFNINTNIIVNEENILSEADKAMTQEILDNIAAIEEAMEVKNLINNFWTIVAEDSKKALEQWNNAFDKEEQDDFITDMNVFIEEGEKLHTAELLRIEQEKQFECDRNIKVLNSILDDEDLVAEYGNKAITRDREIAPMLNKVPTGCNKSLIQITIDSYGCTYSQAVSKLAQKFNINYDHDTWFKSQLEVIEHNKKLINNPTEIVMKYPQLWNKMKQDAHMRKYYIFLLELFQTQLEHKGLSQRGKMPLMASASCGFIAKSLRVGYMTAYRNMNNLTMFGATNKLTDKQVKKYDKSRYESVMNLRRNEEESTITTYELIMWTDEILKAMNDMIIEKQRTRATNKGQSHMMFDAIGHGDVMNKSNRVMTDIDKMIIADLKKWSRKKAIDSTGCGFITMDDLNARLDKISKDCKISIGKANRDKYITIVMADLGLSYEYISKELKSIINSKKLNKINYGKVWIHMDKANKLNKYNN